MFKYVCIPILLMQQDFETATILVCCKDSNIIAFLFKLILTFKIKINLAFFVEYGLAKYFSEKSAILINKCRSILAYMYIHLTKVNTLNSCDFFF